MVAWTVMLAGCFADLFPEAPVAPDTTPAPVADVETEPEKLEIPAQAGATTADVGSGGGEKEAPAVKWNPISIPQGPREGGGVRWEGVKRKSPYSNIDRDDVEYKMSMEALKKKKAAGK